MNNRLLLLLVVLMGSPPCRAAEALYAGKPLAFWLDELKSQDALIREEAILVLTDAGAAARSATARLEELVNDRERGVRIRAALALWRIAGQTKPALQVLTEALRDPALPNRAEVLSRLGELGGAAGGSAPVVLPFLNDADGLVRSQAIQTMQRFGAGAVPSLLLSFHDANPSVRRAAFYALGLLGPSAKEAVPKLATLLENGDAETRLESLLALGRIGETARSATSAIVKQTGDKDARLRAASLSALQTIAADPKIARRAAVDALEDDDLLVRSRGVTLLRHVAPNHPDILLHVLELIKQPVGRTEMLVLLGQMGPKGARAVPTLTNLLADADPLTQRLAIQTLGQMGAAARPAVPKLLEQLRAADFMTRQAAVNAVRAIGGDGERIVAAVLEAAQRDMTTRSMCLPLLADQGSKARAAVPWLVAELRKQPPSYVTVQMAETLHKIDPESADKEAVPLLRKMLLPVNPWRVEAATALRRLKPDDDEAMKTLIDCLTASQFNIRQQACYHLGTLGKSARAAAPALRKTLRDSDFGIRVGAATSLWKISGETDSTVPVLLEALKPSPNNFWRAQAANLLGEMGPALDKSALPELRKYRDDVDRFVRYGIQRAIQRIEESTNKTKTP